MCESLVEIIFYDDDFPRLPVKGIIDRKLFLVIFSFLLIFPFTGSQKMSHDEERKKAYEDKNPDTGKIIVLINNRNPHQVTPACGV